MRVDVYTKAMLTIIAAALLYLCAMSSGEGVFAQAASAGHMSLGKNAPQPVVVVGWGTVRASDGEIVLTTRQDAGTGVVHTDPAMPVAIQDAPDHPLSVKFAVSPEHPLPVGITAIKPWADWEPIRTRVEAAPTQRRPGEIQQ
jgi:hypothetical protein